MIDTEIKSNHLSTLTKQSSISTKTKVKLVSVEYIPSVITPFPFPQITLEEAVIIDNQTK